MSSIKDLFLSIHIRTLIREDVMKYQWRTVLFSLRMAVIWTLSVKSRLQFYIMCIYGGTKLNWGTNSFINRGWRDVELLFLASQHHHQRMDWVLNSRKYRLCKPCEKHFILFFAHGIWESSVEEMLEEPHDASDSYDQLCQEVEKLLFLIQ